MSHRFIQVFQFNTQADGFAVVCDADRGQYIPMISTITQVLPL